MTQEVIILRGIAGSGKSYTAREMSDLTPNADIVSTVRDLIRSLEAGAPSVIVDNLNLMMHQVAAFYAVAEAYNANVYIETQFIDPMQAARNCKAPLDVLLAQYARMLSEQAAFPTSWNHVIEPYGGSGPLNNMNELELIGQKLVDKIQAYRERETVKEDQKALENKAAERAADENYSDDNEDFG